MSFPDFLGAVPAQQTASTARAPNQAGDALIGTCLIALVRHWRGIALGICGVIGIAGPPALGAGNDFDGVYTGNRVLTKGSPSCPNEDEATVNIHGAALTFTDSRLHDCPLGFYPHPDGSFSQISAGIESSFVLIQGRIAGDTIDADVADGACEYHWHLKRSR
jgi:hypothetical protein